MAYPEKLLSEGEVVVSEFRPHWSALSKELGMMVAGLILSFLARDLLFLFLVVWVVVFALAIRGLIRWATTTHVITNRRVIHRTGLFAKQGREIPLENIHHIAFNQTIIEKLFETGDLMIESAGTHGQTRYHDISDPEKVQSMLYQVREDRIMAMRGSGGGIVSEGESIASQLDTLSRLHDDGKLSDEEFEAEKRKLLES